MTTPDDRQDREDWLAMRDAGPDGPLPEPPADPSEPPRRTGRPVGTMLIVVLVALLVVAAVVRFTQHRHGSAAAPTAAAASTETRGATRHHGAATARHTHRTPRPSRGPVTGPAPTAPTGKSADRKFAARFVAATLDTSGKTRNQWMRAVRPFCTAQFARQLALTDPATIPHQRITGPAHVSSVAMTGTETVVFVPTSAQGYTVWLTSDHGHTRVAAAKPGTPPATDQPNPTR